MTGSDELSRLRAALAMPGGASSDFDLNADVQPAAGPNAAPGGGPDRGAAGGVWARRAPDQAVGASAAPSRPDRLSRRQAGAGAIATRSARRCARPKKRSACRRAPWSGSGRMPPHETVTGFSVTPLVGLVTRAFTPVPEAGEVDEVFAVPLRHVTDPARFRVEGRRWQGRRRLLFRRAVRALLRLGRDGADAAGAGRPVGAMRLTADWLSAAPVQRVIAGAGLRRNIEPASSAAASATRSSARGVTDIDIATSATPEAVLALAEAAGIKVRADRAGARDRHPGRGRAVRSRSPPSAATSRLTAGTRPWPSGASLEEDAAAPRLHHERALCRCGGRGH